MFDCGSRQQEREAADSRKLRWQVGLDGGNRKHEGQAEEDKTGWRQQTVATRRGGRR